MYIPHLLYNPHQAFQGVKSSGLYTKKYGTILLQRPSKEMSNLSQYNYSSNV